MDITQEEKEFRWAEAATRYEEALKSGPSIGSSAAQLWNRMGYCYDLASRQTTSVEESTSLRQLSIEAYKNASDLFAADLFPENAGKKEHCLAQAEYVRSWLAPNPDEKAKILDNCWVKAKAAMQLFKSAGNDLYYGKTANLLWRCLFDRVYIATTGEQKDAIAQEALNSATDAITVFQKLGDKEELLTAFAQAAVQSWYSAIACENEAERNKIGENSVRYAGKALALSGDVDPFYKAVSRWGSVWANLFFTEDIETCLKYANELLEQATIVRDNYFRGMASYMICDITDMKIPSEANPNLRKQLYDDIIKHSEEGIRCLNLVFQDAWTAQTYLLPAQTYSALASDFAVDLAEKLEYSKKAIEVGRKGLEHAVRSGSPEALLVSLHGLSKACHYHANLESRKNFKLELLTEALRLRREYLKIARESFTTNFWILGVGLVYAAQIETDLSRVEEETKKKSAILREAIDDMEQGVSHSGDWVTSHPVPSFVVKVANYEDALGGALDEDFRLTTENKSLVRANQAYAAAAEDFKKVDLPSRVAESYWKIAKNMDRVSNYDQSARNFETAFAAYKAAAQRIAQFSDFYLDYASYMKAWSEIEFAKLAHSEEKYEAAMQHYEKTSQLLRQSKSWMYLSQNFYAWSLLEQAEDLSRKENSQESIEAFQEAIKFLQESKRILSLKLQGIDKKDEKDLVERLINVTDTRSEYSHGRIAIEEAKNLDKQGDHAASSEKYNKAAEIFQKLSMVETGEAAKEAKPLYYLCQAWQKMTLAEAKSSPTMYKEAAELFRQANEHSSKEAASLMALGHSSFCKALEAGTEFETTQTMATYEQATRHLDAAANYYLKAGFETTSDYAKATQRLFDAYVYMESAKRERDTAKQTRFYSMAEKVLEIAAEYFIKAGYQGKTDQVQRLVRKVKEERALALSLDEIFHAPAVTASTATFSTISSSEEAVGLERFEHADIQTKLIQHETDIKVGDTVNIEIQMVNVGKEPVSLVRIEDVVPAGFQLVNKPDYCKLENVHLTVRGKRLNPLKTEEIKIALRSFKQGSIEVKPRIVCVDWAGQQMIYSPEPVAYNISSTALPGRVSTGYADLDNLLFGGIPENYSVALASPSCDEREQLIKSFLDVGTKNGQMTYYVTAEVGDVADLAKGFPSNSNLFVCNPRSDGMIEGLPNVFRLKGVDSLTDLNIALIKSFRNLAASQTEPKRFCITIISDILLQHHAVTTRKWLSELLPNLKSKGFTTLAVINPEMHPPEEVQAILGLFEGEIRISEKETEKGLEKVLRIRKLYNQRYLGNELVLARDRLEC